MRIVVGNIQGVKDEECMTDLLDQLKGRSTCCDFDRDTFDARESEESRRWRMSLGRC